VPLKNTHIISNIIFLGVCLSFIKCKVPQAKKEWPAINEMHKKNLFRINLPEKHDLGYIWQLNRNFNTKIVEELNAVWHGNEKGVDFNFSPLSVGQTTLNFMLIKYNDTINTKAFIVKIIDN
jgi:hypothetical protein